MTAVPSVTALCDLEPRLRQLEQAVRARARTAYRKKNWCANAAWYGYGRFGGHSSFKNQLYYLVGYARRDHPVLGTSEAYDVAYRHLYRLIPDCRRCGCL